MGKVKFSELEFGEIRGFLASNWPVNDIIAEFSASGKSISRRTIFRVKDGSARTKRETMCNRGRPPKISSADLKKLDIFTSKIDPPDQASMAKKFKVCQQTISYNIRRRLGKKHVKKAKVHGLTDSKRKSVKIALWSFIGRFQARNGHG